MLNNFKKRYWPLKKKKMPLILHTIIKLGIYKKLQTLSEIHLELCIKASQIKDADLVVFCGVDFMAETAAILNPDKRIVITG